MKNNEMKTIAEATPIIPELLAEIVTLDEAMQQYLVQRAERHFRDDKHFRAKVKSKGNYGRDYLLMFMTHWYEGVKKNKKLMI